jgi:uncharacterized membrane protein
LTDKKTIWLAWTRLLWLFALAGAVFLAWTAMVKGPVPGCAPGTGCDRVLQSHWAYWLDIPVSLPAAIAYLVLLAATIALPRRRAPEDQQAIWAIIIVLSVAVMGAAAWFIGLQAFVIHAFCKFCMAIHLCGMAAAIISLKNVPISGNPRASIWSPDLEKPGLPRNALVILGFLGVMGISVLVLGQVLLPKEMNVVKSISVVDQAATPGQPSLSSATNIAGAPTNRLAPPALQRMANQQISLYQGKFTLRLEEVPMLGSPNAQHIIIALTDYTCVFCWSLHRMMAEAQRRVSNQLGIVILPMPMSTNCNPYAPTNLPSNPESCEFARLTLALWKTDRAAFEQFSKWLFVLDKAPPVDRARDYAAQLLGSDRLEKALQDPWIDKQIQTNCAIHQANYQFTREVAMPQLIIGNYVSVGPLNSVQHLLLLLDRYLGMKYAPAI